MHPYIFKIVVYYTAVSHDLTTVHV